MNHPTANHLFRLSGGLLMLAVFACSSGCSGSSASLAIEGSGTPVLPVATSAPEVQVVSQNTQGTESSGLQPKLTTVDRDQLVGCWRDSFFGTRTLTLNSDGTATMVLELDFAGRLLYGSRLEFDMEWSVEGAVVTIDITEGRPAKSAKSAMDTWGSRYVYLLDCVADHKIEMRDSDGSMNHALRRISDQTEADSK